MPNSDGIIVILSYPDTVVRPAYSEFSSKIWPLIGVGGKHAVQAGHAALLLIKKGESEINYFDFGRYITSFGNGRVRSKETDPELVVPVKAKFEKDTLINLDDILLWLDKHPEKTHGEGRLIASTNTKIDYTKASIFIKKLIAQKEVPYGAFVKNGTNCARFVTDTIVNSTKNKKIKKQLKTSNLLTPSPIGNVIKGTSNNKIFEVNNQKIDSYKNRSILKEYRECFLKRIDSKPNLIGTEKPNTTVFSPKNATWLGGIGSGAWFKVGNQIDERTFTIFRYTSEGIKDFEGIYTANCVSFDTGKEYKFVYPTNYKEIFIKQGKNIFTMIRKN